MHEIDLWCVNMAIFFFFQFDWIRLLSSQSGICRRTWSYQSLPGSVSSDNCFGLCQSIYKASSEVRNLSAGLKTHGTSEISPLYRNRYGFPQIPLHFRSYIHVYHCHLTSWCLRSNTLFGFERVVTMLYSHSVCWLASFPQAQCMW